jgi:aryl-alcohol dehydrogenase-like predicted oxidoreductase
LTGKFGVGRQPESGRLTVNKMYQTRYGDEINFEVADRLTAYAATRGEHPATLAVAWVMSHPAITAPIVGARNLAQLEPSLRAAELKMMPEWRAELTALTPEPPSATDRSEEKKGMTYQGALAK